MGYALMGFDEVIDDPTGMTCLAGTKSIDHVNKKVYMLCVNHEGAALSGGEVVIHEAGYLKGERVDLGDACCDGPVAGVVASGYLTDGVGTGDMFWALRKGTISMLAGTQCASLAVGHRVVAASLNAGCFRELPAAPSGSAGIVASLRSADINYAQRIFGYVLAAGGGTLAAAESIFVNLEDNDIG